MPEEGASAHPRGPASSAFTFEPRDDRRAERAGEAEGGGQALEARRKAGGAERPMEGHGEEELGPAGGLPEAGRAEARSTSGHC